MLIKRSAIEPGIKFWVIQRRAVCLSHSCDLNTGTAITQHYLHRLYHECVQYINCPTLWVPLILSTPQDAVVSQRADVYW
jgi:hypothetical protein